MKRRRDDDADCATKRMKLSKITLQDCQEFARDKGGECLSLEYNNARKLLQWRCDKKHEWEASFDSIKNKGTWCPTCAGNVPASLQECQEFAKGKGGECLSEEYKNNKTPIQWRCDQKHEWKAKYSNIKRGQWCPKCAKNAPLSLQECQEFAQGKGGECLSLEYNSKTPMRWQCDKGHEWEACFTYVKRGTWCPQCANEAKRGRKITKITLQECQEFAEGNGGECLSMEYKNNGALMQWRCDQKHEWMACFSSIKYGRWCPKCSKNAPLSLQECQEFAKGNGGECLSTEYNNSREPMQWRCDNKHEWTASFNSIKNAGSWCPTCAGKAPLSLQECQEFAKEKGGECLSLEYKNSKAPMQWRCDKGHEWKACFSSINRMGTWCPTCVRKALLSLQECQEFAKGKGGECLSLEYKNSKEPMQWRCDNGHKWTACFGNIKNGGTWCLTCAGCAPLSLQECQEFAKAKGGECLSLEYNGALKPILWRCDQKHEWKSNFNNIKNNGSWCPKCAGKAPLSLQECQEFAKGKGGECLSLEYKNSKTPMQWRCDMKHEWNACFGNIKNAGSWCPTCSPFKTERLCRAIIEQLTGLEFPKTRLPHLGISELDGYNEEHCMAFEFQGEQHYNYIQRFHYNGLVDLFAQQARDARKQQLCEQNGIQLVIIPYTQRRRLVEFIKHELMVLGFDTDAAKSGNDNNDGFDLVALVEEQQQLQFDDDDESSSDNNESMETD